MNHRATWPALMLALMAIVTATPAKTQGADGARRAPDDPVPVFKPGTIDVIVAGGDASPMMQAWHMYRPQTVSIDRWR